MEYKIYGGTRLFGQVPVSGSKNGALPILFASLLGRGESTLFGMPDIEDVRIAYRLLRAMGASVTELDPHTVRVSRADFTCESVPEELTARFRASSYLLGTCLSLFGRAPDPAVGGCDFGKRPLDCHYDVFHAMGAVGDGELTAREGIRPTEHTFPLISVGATVNALLAAVSAGGDVILHECATEPHVTDLERFLLCMGARIDGAGTRNVTVHGGYPLSGTSFVVSSDETEAGTYLAACAAVGGQVRVVGISPSQLLAIKPVFLSMGCEWREDADGVTLTVGKTVGTSFTTAPSPGFPTDLHPPVAASLLFAGTESRITEGVFRERFRYVAPLREFGADMTCSGNLLTVKPAPLHPANVSATDLRGGAALVIAALGVRGRSIVDTGGYIERGYEDFARKLRRLGAEIF